jgi:hypothetical protein
MNKSIFGASFFVAVAAVVHVTGCGPTDIMGTPLAGHYDGPDGGSTTGTQSQGGGCNSSGAPASLPKVDPSTLPACGPACDGAHCVPSADVPSTFQSQLATCSGGFCVPDSMIKSGGAKPASCKSLSSADGVCLSVCVPQVAQYKDLLPQDSCSSDERCAPCTNPLNGQPSGACDIGAPVDTSQCSQPAAPSKTDGGSGGATTQQCPHTGPPVVDPTTLPACGGANSEAHCLDAKLVPPAMVAKLATCPTGYCVPDKLIASGGQYIPKTCTSVAGGEGRCTNTVIPQIAAQASMLPQDVCDASEKCAPCYDPLTGADSGACHISCDPGPTKPAVTFAKCCTDKNSGTSRGRCVPTTSIPATEQKQLATDTCTKGTDSCVPNDLLDPNFKPNPCSATNFLTGDYTGVCLSTCLDFGFAGIAIAQGNCDSTHTCAPCTNPLTGAATGAPGCPK